MALLAWNDTYTINNETLDSHHMTLFDIFNRLYDSSLDINDSNTFHTILTELDTYSKYHFKAEEQYMRDVEYNDIERHMSLHKYFSARLLDIKEREKNDNNDLCRELIYFLGNWLKHHVVEDDKRLSL